MISCWDGKVTLITGGTGTLGHALVRHLLRRAPAKVIILSRDELKQEQMRRQFPDARLRFFLGDVRDRDRLARAFGGVDIVVHAAALKQVPACEYNPFEAVATNVLGTRHVVEAAIDRCVERVVVISSDKACAPVNTYGKTKATAEALAVQGNAYSRATGVRFAVCRYGNVFGSRGSVVPLFREQAKTGTITITDPSMTRFWLPTARAVWLIEEALRRMSGGEIFVPKAPSSTIGELAAAIAPGCALDIVGVRPGEKRHETLITADEARLTVDLGELYVIQPAHPWWDMQSPGGAPAPGGAKPDPDEVSRYREAECLTSVAANRDEA